MSRNAVFLFSVWTSLLSAVFYFLYGFTAFGVPWVMFVCLAIFFGMGGHVRDVYAMCLSALAGCVWGKVDFLLMDLFQNLGLGLAATLVIGIVLAALCSLGMEFAVKRFPLPKEGERS